MAMNSAEKNTKEASLRRASNAAINTKQIWVGIDLHALLVAKATEDGRTIRMTAERILREALTSPEK